MSLSRVSVLFATVAALGSCAHPPGPTPPPPSPPPPKPCVQAACIALYTQPVSSGANECKTSIDPNNRGIFVQFPYGNIVSPVIFHYERVQTDESNTIIERKTGYVELTPNSRNWVFCTQTRDPATGAKRINWLSRLCATNRTGASKTDCTSYEAKEKWPVDDRWIPTYYLKGSDPKARVKVLDCPALCNPQTPLCRKLPVSKGFDWVKYESARKVFSSPASFPLSVKRLDSLVGSDLAKSGRTDDLSIIANQYLVQQGPATESSNYVEVNGKLTQSTLRLPTAIRAKYDAKLKQLTLTFDTPEATPLLIFGEPGVDSLYGGKVRKVWFERDSVLFATDKRCVALKK